MTMSPQQQIEQLQNQLRCLEQLACLGQLTSTATHEFNNILMTIINYARLGIRNKDDLSRDKAFDRILEVSQRAAKITGTILAQSRRGGDFEPTNLGELISDTLVLLEKELQKYRISVELDLQAVPSAMANASEMQRVLINLLINARQAMPGGGTVWLQTKAERQHVVITVRDYGCGITGEDLPKIFQPFFTTKTGPDASGLGGTGLGLAACKDIVEAHQGRIRVESTLGKGTAFIIRIPQATAEQAIAS